jgi:hypothetical protein
VGAVPLTAELSNPSSRIRRWFDTRLPHIDALQPGWTAALAGTRTLYPRHDGVIDWSGIGTAFGYRLGYALSWFPPYHALRALTVLTWDDTARHRVARMFQAHQDLPADCSADLRPLPDGRALLLPDPAYLETLPAPQPGASDALVKFFTRLSIARHLWQLSSPCPPDVEEPMARICYALALLEAVYRRGLATAANWLPATCYDLTDAYLRSLAPNYAINDLVQLAHALTSKGLPQFPVAPTIVSPEFVADWADADLLIGDLLIDCKTTIRPRQLHPEWIYQLLGYTLLDTADYYHIRKIGIYLPRQTRLVTWTLDHLTAALSDGPAPALPDLRAEFAQQATATLQRQDPQNWASRWITKKPPTPHQPE